MVRFALVMAACCVAGQASAQINGFIAGGLGANTTQTDLTISTIGIEQKTAGGSSNLPALQLEIGARLRSGDVQYGIGFHYHPLSYDAYEDSFFGTLRTSVKDVMGVFGELGWNASPQTVLYGRLSYNQGKVTFQADQPGFGTATVSDTFHGYGFGAGIRHSVSANVYVFVDWHHIQGDEVTMPNNATFAPGIAIRIKPSMTTGLIGAGWTF